MSKPSSFEYTLVCSDSTTNIDILIFNSNGQMITANNIGTQYNISIIDPLNLGGTSYSLTTSSANHQISYNGTNYQAVAINNLTSTTFNLNIDGFSSDSFSKYYLYGITYSLIPLVNPNEIDRYSTISSSELFLSNKSSWSYTFKNVPEGIWKVAISISGPNGFILNLDNAGKSYIIVNQFVKITPTNSDTAYGQSNNLSITSAACAWTEIQYEWEQSTDKGKTWINLSSGNLSSAHYLDLSNIPNCPISGDCAGEYKLVITNANGIYQTLTSNIVNIKQSLYTPTINFTNGTYIEQVKNYTMAFISTNTNSFDIAVSLSQYGKKCSINASDLNNISFIVYGSEWNNQLESIYSNSNLSFFYNSSTKSIIIPVPVSQLEDAFPSVGDGIYLTLQLEEDGQFITSNYLPLQYLSITLDDTGTIYSSLYNSDGVLAAPLYFEWQKSSNGINGWNKIDDISCGSLNNINPYPYVAVYYRLIFYDGVNKDSFSSSNVIKAVYQ